MVKAPTRAFSLLKALTTAFTFKTLLGPQAFFAEESINSFVFLQNPHTTFHCLKMMMNLTRKCGNIHHFFNPSLNDVLNVKALVVDRGLLHYYTT